MRFLFVLVALVCAFPPVARAIGTLPVVDEPALAEEPLGPPVELPPDNPAPVVDPVASDPDLLCRYWLPVTIDRYSIVPMPEWPMSIFQDPYTPADPVPVWWWQSGELPVREVQ